MFKCLYHPGRVGTRCLNLIKLNSYHSFRISEATDKHFYLSFITFYMLSKDILCCLLDYLTIVIEIIRWYSHLWDTLYMYQRNRCLKVDLVIKIYIRYWSFSTIDVIQLVWPLNCFVIINGTISSNCRQTKS